MEFTGFLIQFVSNIIQVKYLIGSIFHVLQIFPVEQCFKYLVDAGATVGHHCIPFILCVYVIEKEMIKMFKAVSLSSKGFIQVSTHLIYM